MQKLQEIKARLVKTKTQLKPCTPQEVIKVEEFYKVSLPAVYKEFLLMMGKGAGEYMAGSSVFYDEIFFLRQYAKELIRDNSLQPLPDNAFVFWLHQGYQMAFFLLDENEHLPVYYFGEGEGMKSVEIRYSRFIDFLEQELTMSFRDVNLKWHQRVFGWVKQMVKVPKFFKE
ncbi:SMI1/KNR4 family protein [Chitinophaga agrisoli]|uniref:SMI1/KNR4 family protein n=1 Tax=Chitinophaga agrisoli TaxID=2607653 RepID=UPI001BCA1689|nr:SMI1/KNR4 family protein [Chitinophaga agrisoli]